MKRVINYAETVHIPSTKFLYRVVHRIMEGDCEYDHGPRIMDINAFDIGKYPVTNSMYKVFLDKTGYQPTDGHNFLKHWENGTWKDGEANFPVVWLSQKDALAYTSWVGGRLPFDYEWQYAAAGKEMYIYPWGNKFNKSYCNSSSGSLTSVDCYPQGVSPFGVFDMCGNAHEWVNDVINDGMHIFTFLRGGCYFQAPHFWHTDGGARPNYHHLKFQLLNEGHNRCGTTSFRVVLEIT